MENADRLQFGDRGLAQIETGLNFPERAGPVRPGSAICQPSRLKLLIHFFDWF